MKFERNEFDGVIRIVSDTKLELNSTVNVPSKKSGTVSRFITSYHGELNGKFYYNYTATREEAFANRCIECGHKLSSRESCSYCGGF